MSYHTSHTLSLQETPSTWGRIRNTDATYDNATLQVTNRGYTGHEHMLSVALVNMNGRMYDPLLGRMLSPDNYTQAVDMTQNFNRYSYALNNPLVHVDPDGELIFIIPSIGWSRQGGIDIGVTVGIGVPGILSAQATAGYNFASDNLYGSLGGSVGGFTASVGYGTQTGMTAGLNFGLPGLSEGFGTNLTSFGINWTQNGGVYANALGFSYGQGSLSFNPSLSYSYSVLLDPVSQKTKREYLLNTYKEELISEFGKEVYETTKFKSTLFPKSKNSFGYTVALDEQVELTISKSDRQKVVINRKYVNRFYKGRDVQIAKSTVFHEYFHASDFHNGLPTNEFWGVDTNGIPYTYSNNPMEIRAYTYEYNKFGTGGYFFGR